MTDNTPLVLRYFLLKAEVEGQDPQAVRSLQPECSLGSYLSLEVKAEVEPGKGPSAVEDVMAAAVFSPSSPSLDAWEERRHPAHAIKRAKGLFLWDRGMILCLTLKVGSQPRALGEAYLTVNVLCGVKSS